MSKTEKEIMEELEQESEKLMEEAPTEIPEMTVEAPVTAALEEETEALYEKTPAIGMVTAAGSGKASHALVDYSFTSTYRILWAYAGGAWRHRKINDAQVAGIAKVAMEATRIDVWWSNGNLNFIRCWKKY